MSAKYVLQVNECCMKLSHESKYGTHMLDIHRQVFLWDMAMNMNYIIKLRYRFSVI